MSTTSIAEVKGVSSSHPNGELLANFAERQAIPTSINEDKEMRTMQPELNDRSSTYLPSKLVVKLKTTLGDSSITKRKAIKKKPRRNRSSARVRSQFRRTKDDHEVANIIAEDLVVARCKPLTKVACQCRNQIRPRIYLSVLGDYGECTWECQNRNV